jgi:hypothetical protein
MEILTTPYARRLVRREFLLLVAAGGLGALRNADAQEGNSSVSEYEVKAALLYKFLRFVKWPESANQSESTVFRIGVLGEDPFGSALDDTMAGKSVGDLPITILRSQKLEDVLVCPVLFVCASEKERLEPILVGAQKASILIVADTDGFAEQGVMINLVLRDKKVRFQINYEAAREAKIEVDAQLLKLAELVGPKNG